MRKKITNPLGVAGLLAGLSGCGVRVPDFQENPLANDVQRVAFVRAVTRNVTCELRDAVARLYARQEETNPQNRLLGWFDSWGAQLTLTLSINERSTIAPNVSFTPLSFFNIGVGLSASTQADREGKFGAFFLISEVKQRGPCHPSERGQGAFILQSDLEYYDWLFANVQSANLGDTPPPGSTRGPLGSNVFSQTIKFTITTSGGIMPAWKLSRFSANQSGTFLDASRDRVQELIITFGPTDESVREPVVDAAGRQVVDPLNQRPITRPAALAPAAAAAALTSEIQGAVARGFRSGLAP